jgi:hypothetical protein
VWMGPLTVVGGVAADLSLWQQTRPAANASAEPSPGLVSWMLRYRVGIVCLSYRTARVMFVASRSDGGDVEWARSARDSELFDVAAVASVRCATAIAGEPRYTPGEVTFVEDFARPVKAAASLTREAAHV